MKKFNTSSIEKNSAVLIIGKRATGKTTLVEKILENASKETNVIVLTRNSSDNDSYNKQLNVKVCLDCNTEYDKFMSFMEKESKKYDECVKNGTDFLECPDLDYYVVMDGCLCIDDIDKFKGLITDIKHLRTTIIITTQYLSDSPSLKYNFDYIFCFRENNSSNLKRVYNFVEYKGSFEEFKEMYDKYTQDYNSLVYSTKTKEFYCSKVSQKL